MGSGHGPTPSSSRSRSSRPLHHPQRIHRGPTRCQQVSHRAGRISPWRKPLERCVVRRAAPRPHRTRPRAPTAGPSWLSWPALRALPSSSGGPASAPTAARRRSGKRPRLARSVPALSASNPSARSRWDRSSSTSAPGAGGSGSTRRRSTASARRPSSRRWSWRPCRRAPTLPPPPASHRYWPCPECRRLMNRQNFARVSGIIVDVCKGHGVWFNQGELRRIIEFIRDGGMSRARQRERDDLEDQRARLRAAERDARLAAARPATWSHGGEARTSDVEILSAVRGLLDWIYPEPAARGPQRPRPLSALGLSQKSDISVFCERSSLSAPQSARPQVAPRAGLRPPPPAHEPGARSSPAPSSTRTSSPRASGSAARPSATPCSSSRPRASSTILPRRGVRVRALTVEDVRHLYEVVGALEGAAVLSALPEPRSGRARRAAAAERGDEGRRARRRLRPLLRAQPRLPRRLPRPLRQRASSCGSSAVSSSDSTTGRDAAAS